MLYFNPYVQSWSWYQKKQFKHDFTLYNEQNNLSLVRATPQSEIKNQTEIKFQDLPSEYQFLLASFSQPQIFKTDFKDQTHGFVIKDQKPKLQACPVFPNQISKKLKLSLRKTQSLLAHYEYQAENMIVIAQTRAKAFACEIEVVIKSRPFK